MPTRKLSEQDFKEIEKKQRHLVNCSYLRYENSFAGVYDSPANNVKNYVESATGEAAQKERSNQVKKQILDEFLKDNTQGFLKDAIQKVEPYFEGSKSDASSRAKTLFRNFQYQNDLMLTAWEHFQTHLGNSNNFFSANIYQQWLAAVKVGLYTAPDLYVLGRSGLNYADNASPSPRLEAVKEYYGEICVMRELLAIIEQEIHRWCRGWWW